MNKDDRRGFTTVFLLIALMLMAAAAVSLATVFASEVRRTRQAQHETQARILLLAGMDYAKQKVDGGVSAGHVEVSVPADAHAALAFDLRKPAESGNIEAVITAQSAEFVSRQVVVFSRDAHSPGWFVKSATLAK